MAAFDPIHAPRAITGGVDCRRSARSIPSCRRPEVLRPGESPGRACHRRTLRRERPDCAGLARVRVVAARDATTMNAVAQPRVEPKAGVACARPRVCMVAYSDYVFDARIRREAE